MPPATREVHNEVAIKIHTCIFLRGKLRHTRSHTRNMTSPNQIARPLDELDYQAWPILFCIVFDMV